MAELLLEPLVPAAGGGLCRLGLGVAARSGFALLLGTACVTLTFGLGARLSLADGLVEERAKVAACAGLNVGDHDPLSGDLNDSPPIGGFRSRLDQHHVKCLEEREVEIAVEG